MPAPLHGPLGIIGAGAIGSTLARLAIAAGLDVVIANSRGPESLAELVEQLGPQARAATAAQVAHEADIVIAAIPLIAHTSLPIEELKSKILIDTTNYYPERDGQIAVLDDLQLTASELVHDHLPATKVVKAFNSITFASLGKGARPAGSPDRNALPIAGDDTEAKAQVTALLDVLGYDAVDTGFLADSWRSEPGTPVYCDPYLPAWPTEKLTLDQLVGWLLAAPVVTVSRQRVQELVDSAVRGPAGGYFPETA